MIEPDEPTPATYDPVLQTGDDDPRPGWIEILRQDDATAPGKFPFIRKLLASGADLTGHYNLVVELFQEPPREYPPQHIGQVAAGIDLNLAEATAVHDAIGRWIAAQTQDGDED